MDDPLVTLGFLSIFHVVGAVVLAIGLRTVWKGLHNKGQGIVSALYLVLWGALFGCMPFAFGVELATKESGTPLVLFGEAAIWGSVFLTALLAWDAIMDWLRPFLDTDMFLVAFGGLFMIVGTGAASFIVRDDLRTGLLIGGLFTLVGGVFFAIGARNALKGMR